MIIAENNDYKALYEVPLFDADLLILSFPAFKVGSLSENECRTDDESLLYDNGEEEEVGSFFHICKAMQEYSSLYFGNVGAWRYLE